jgi:hypothetical protein
LHKLVKALTAHSIILLLLLELVVLAVVVDDDDDDGDNDEKKGKTFEFRFKKLRISKEEFKS